jgi:hypothetical protein
MFLGWFLPNVCLLKYKMAATAGHSFIIGRPLWENRKIIFSILLSPVNRVVCE